jgi:hypothetical protein
MGVLRAIVAAAPAAGVPRRDPNRKTMRTQDELERFYLAQAAAPRDRGTLDLIVVRVSSGVHATPPSVELSPTYGMAGDRWSAALFRDRDRQITLMMTSAARAVCDGQPLDIPGDNLLVNLDLGSNTLPIGSRLRIGAALLEVTRKPHAGCKKFSARFGPDALHWVNDARHATRKLRGINCRVIEGGSVSVGNFVEVVSR